MKELSTEAIAYEESYLVQQMNGGITNFTPMSGKHQSNKQL